MLALVLVCIALLNICSVAQGVSQKPAKLYALEILIIAGGCGCARKLCCALQAPIKFCFSMMEGPSYSSLIHCRKNFEALIAFDGVEFPRSQKE